MGKLSDANLKEFLDEKYHLYHNKEFIESDPIQIPHRFSNAEDIEIAGFLSATIAWGKRSMIIRNAGTILDRMDDSPHDFILNAEENDIYKFNTIKHRTFNGIDCMFFIKSLQNIYKNHGGLKSIFENSVNNHGEIAKAIIDFRKIFFEIPHPERTGKHIANVEKNSAAKRINMYLRWMVRNDKRQVDFGLWQAIPTSKLYMPLDVHSGNVARKLQLLKRTQNDWKAVVELTENLRKFDANDPVKYDYALFGLGVFENF